jgi:acetyl esterase/lipase
VRNLTALLAIITFIAIARSEETTHSVPKDTSFTVYSAFIKESKRFPFIRIVASEPPHGIVAEKDVIYSSIGKRPLHLDLFYPAHSQTARCPGIILIHGGGWRSGDRSQQVPMAQYLASKGYVTAAVEYHLSPEARYPAAVYDLKAAIRWMRANAAKYRIDSTKIGILGCSSGGQLAALVGNTNGIAKFEGDGDNRGYSSDAQAVVDIDGIVDFTSPEARKYEDDPVKKPSAAGAWFGGTYKEKRDLWQEASPIFYVNKKSPPILFVNSSIPRFHCGRDEMIKKLEEYHIYSQVQTIPDTPHPFWLFHPWFGPTCDYVLKFFDRTLKAK